MFKKQWGAVAAWAVLAAVGAASANAQSPRWDEHLGQKAPPLMATGWVGTPVSLAALKGNTVVLAFWNADIPC